MTYDNTTVTATDSKWKARIEQRRKEGGRSVLNYVNQIIRCNNVLLEDVASFLTSDEVQQLRNIIADREKAEAEAAAYWAAQERERQMRANENERLRTAFWEKNPPSCLVAAPNIETESQLLDVLACYHIAKVEYSVEIVRYHWEDFEYIESADIKAWLESDIDIDLEDGLPGDEDCEIGTAILEAIKELASERAAKADNAGRIQDGTAVIFDVPNRRINLDAIVEVTRKESFKDSWSPDQDSNESKTHERKL
jgi:hypothetical protein